MTKYDTLLSKRICNDCNQPIANGETPIIVQGYYYHTNCKTVDPICLGCKNPVLTSDTSAVIINGDCIPEGDEISILNKVELELLIQELTVIKNKMDSE